MVLDYMKSGLKISKDENICLLNESLNQLKKAWRNNIYNDESFIKNLQIFEKDLMEIDGVKDSEKLNLLKDFMSFYVEQNFIFSSEVDRRVIIFLSNFSDLMLNYPISFIVKNASLFTALDIRKSNKINLFNVSTKYKKDELIAKINTEIKDFGVSNLDVKNFMMFMKSLNFNRDEILKSLAGLNIYEFPFEFFKNDLFQMESLYIHSKDMYNLDELINIANFAIKYNLLSSNLAKVYLSKYIKDNLDKLKNNLSGWENVSYWIDSTETFWFLYFKFIAFLNHDSLRASLDEEKIIENFYSCPILSSDVSLRIPPEYDISISSLMGNIAYSICFYTISFKERGGVTRAYPINMFNNLLKIINDNDKILLKVKITVSYENRKNLFDAINSKDYSFRFPAEHNPSSFSFFKKKSYIKKTGDFISFPSLEDKKETPSSVVKEDLVVKNEGELELLNIWGVNEKLLNIDEISAIKELAKIIFNIRNFLKSFKSIEEDVLFLEDRVDVYAKDLIVSYQDSIKLNNDLKVLSNVKINHSPYFIENLSLLQKQVQYCIDKVVEDYMKVQTFEQKKMKIFLEDRFPDAL